MVNELHLMQLFLRIALHSLHLESPVVPSRNERVEVHVSAEHVCWPRCGFTTTGAQTCAGRRTSALLL